jgi:hypothetical protein
LPPERGQHVELPGLQFVVGERAAPGDVEVPGEPGNPAQHLERLHIEIRSQGPPGLDEIVHLVALPHCHRVP